jgi:hypothetical protein
MSTQYNDQWILDRVNGKKRPAGAFPNKKSARSLRERRERASPWSRLSGTGILGKHPKWIDRDT